MEWNAWRRFLASPPPANDNRLTLSDCDDHTPPPRHPSSTERDMLFVPDFNVSAKRDFSFLSLFFFFKFDFVRVKCQRVRLVEIPWD
jgi:hypothetical protein